LLLQSSPASQEEHREYASSSEKARSSALFFALEEPFLVAALEALAVAADMLAAEDIAADMVAEDIAEDTGAVAEDMVAVEVAEATVLAVAEADMVAAYASTAELVVH
jgi:hypothetical protein